MKDLDKPRIVRVVVDGWTWCNGQKDNIAAARKMLVNALKSSRWRNRVDFALTPGGFVRVGFPFRDIEGGWDSEHLFERLLTPAAKAVNRLLTGAMDRLIDKARYITVGVDLNDTAEKASRKTHAELVALVHANSGKIVRWTGKSYPTTGPVRDRDQSRTLVQAPLESHCFRKGKHRVLILGCHDLHMFGGRGRQSIYGLTLKEARRTEMLKLARELEPEIVLHHPHTTYSPNIWGPPLGSLSQLLPTVAIYASGISFCGKSYCPRNALDDQGWNCRQTLERVLDATKRGPVVDVVVQGFSCPVEKKWKKWARSRC